jgi:hypothetical protein
MRAPHFPGKSNSHPERVSRDLEWAAHTGDRIVAHWQAVPAPQLPPQLCTGVGPPFGYDPTTSFVPVPVPVRNSLILFLPLFSDWTLDALSRSPPPIRASVNRSPSRRHPPRPRASHRTGATILARVNATSGVTPPRDSDSAVWLLLSRRSLYFIGYWILYECLVYVSTLSLATFSILYFCCTAEKEIWTPRWAGRGAHAHAAVRC